MFSCPTIQNIIFLCGVDSGYENKLIAGIVVTGGGSQLKHITQLFEYVTGMDTRIGYPTEHLAAGSSDILTSPMYATGIGLVLKGFEKLEKQRKSENQTQNNTVVGYSKDKKPGGLFDKILSFGKQFFDEETN